MAALCLFLSACGSPFDKAMSEGKAALKEERCKDAEKLFNDVLMDNKNYKLIIKTLKNDTAKQISKEEAAKELEDLKIYTNKRVRLTLLLSYPRA